jgi:hypothetical protein
MVEVCFVMVVLVLRGVKVRFWELGGEVLGEEGNIR